MMTSKGSWKLGASRSTTKLRPVGGVERFRPTSFTLPAASKGELRWTVNTLCVLDDRNIFAYTLLDYCCLLYRSQYSYFSSSHAFKICRSLVTYGPTDAEGSVQCKGSPGELKYPEDEGLRAEPYQGHVCTGYSDLGTI